MVVRRAVLHGLAGAVAVGPALHCRPGNLEAGGDLADRPAFVDDETADDQAVAGCESGVGMCHGTSCRHGRGGELVLAATWGLLSGQSMGLTRMRLPSGSAITKVRPNTSSWGSSTTRTPLAVHSW